jgi:hypothetical protein
MTLALTFARFATGKTTRFSWKIQHLQVELIQARDNYKEFGACERDMFPHVRNPNTDELSGID